MRIQQRTFLIVGRSVNVLAPLRHISVQVEDPPAVRLLFADRVSFFRAIVRKPGVLPELVRLPEIVWAIFAGPAGVFPFRFGGQAITIGRVIAIPIGRLFVIAGFQSLQK